ncbi:hypothetical protein SDC9_88623 [bioreactor metagenome]|uniref:Uncharacterized protein n=1 Tax=bioreactor metagenome TaxID=1076179 RepID=A0A644ZQ07_9ZZZZ
METDPTEGLQHRRAGEGLGEEDHLRVRPADLGQQPGPEVDRLGVRVVHPEDRHAVGDPQPDDPQHLGVDPLRVAVEVDRVDVLVLLRRVLGVRDRAVHPLGEPLRVLADPGMIGRSLQGQVEGHLDAELPGPGDEPVEVLEGAQVGVDRVVAAVGRPDRPDRPGIAGLGGQGVVAALAEGGADRVDRRQVDDVEAHRRGVLEPGDGSVEGAGVPGAVRILVGALGPREELVPGREQGALAVDPHRVLGGGRDQQPRPVGVHGATYATAPDQLDQLIGRALGEQRDRRAAQDRRITASGRCLGPQGRALEQQPALGADQVDIHPLGQLDPGVVQPGAPRVVPALDAEPPGPLGGQADPRLPAVQAGGARRVHVGADLLALGAEGDHGGVDGVVALAPDGRADRERLADHRLGGVRAAGDHRGDVDHRDPADPGPDRRCPGRHRRQLGAGRGGGELIHGVRLRGVRGGEAGARGRGARRLRDCGLRSPRLRRRRLRARGPGSRGLRGGGLRGARLRRGGLRAARRRGGGAPGRRLLGGGLARGGALGVRIGRDGGAGLVGRLLRGHDTNLAGGASPAQAHPYDPVSVACVASSRCASSW